VNIEPRHVHFVAIGGTGMGSLAGLLAARGIRITGSDTEIYPPMSTLLEQWGIPVYSGFRAEHLLEEHPDLVVIGNAVRPDNPEARAAIDEGFHYLSFSDALDQLAIVGKHSVVVSGTHGKTTTTSLLSSLLHKTNRDPSLLIGGYSGDFDGSFREGQGAHFVVEGDEYDTAFFDKTPKFLHYRARTLILTSVEFDVRDVLAAASCAVLGYGVAAEGLDWGVAGLESDDRGTHFDVLQDGRAVARAFVPLFGSFNVENSLGALATAATLGVPIEEAVDALSTFRGVKRRQELRGEQRGVAVIDDFAHHPTAVRGSIEAVRERFAGRRIIAVFEPRTNTSRRAIFQNDYVRALEAADAVYVQAAAERPMYSATGPVTEFFSAQKLVEDIARRGVSAHCLDSVQEIVDQLAGECEPGDVVLCMSNGAFEDIWRRLLDALRT